MSWHFTLWSSLMQENYPQELEQPDQIPKQDACRSTQHCQNLPLTPQSLVTQRDMPDQSTQLGQISRKDVTETKMVHSAVDHKSCGNGIPTESPNQLAQELENQQCEVCPPCHQPTHGSKVGEIHQEIRDQSNPTNSEGNRHSSYNSPRFLKNDNLSPVKEKHENNPNVQHSPCNCPLDHQFTGQLVTTEDMEFCKHNGDPLMLDRHCNVQGDTALKKHSEVLKQQNLPTVTDDLGVTMNVLPAPNQETLSNPASEFHASHNPQMNTVCQKITTPIENCSYPLNCHSQINHSDIVLDMSGWLLQISDTSTQHEHFPAILQAASNTDLNFAQCSSTENFLIQPVMQEHQEIISQLHQTILEDKQEIGRNTGNAKALAAVNCCKHQAGELESHSNSKYRSNLGFLITPHEKHDISSPSKLSGGVGALNFHHPELTVNSSAKMSFAARQILPKSCSYNVSENNLITPQVQLKPTSGFGKQPITKKEVKNGTVNSTLSTPTEKSTSTAQFITPVLKLVRKKPPEKMVSMTRNPRPFLKGVTKQEQQENFYKSQTFSHPSFNTKSVFILPQTKSGMNCKWVPSSNNYKKSNSIGFPINVNTSSSIDVNGFNQKKDASLKWSTRIKPYTPMVSDLDGTGKLLCAVDIGKEQENHAQYFKNVRKVGLKSKKSDTQNTKWLQFEKCHNENTPSPIQSQNHSIKSKTSLATLDSVLEDQDKNLTIVHPKPKKHADEKGMGQPSTQNETSIHKSEENCLNKYGQMFGSRQLRALEPDSWADMGQGLQRDRLWTQDSISSQSSDRELDSCRVLPIRDDNNTLMGNVLLHGDKLVQPSPKTENLDFLNPRVLHHNVLFTTAACDGFASLDQKCPHETMTFPLESDSLVLSDKTVYQNPFVAQTCDPDIPFSGQKLPQNKLGIVTPIECRTLSYQTLCTQLVASSEKQNVFTLAKKGLPLQIVKAARRQGLGVIRQHIRMLHNIIGSTKQGFELPLREKMLAGPDMKAIQMADRKLPHDNLENERNFEGLAMSEKALQNITQLLRPEDNGVAPLSQTLVQNKPLMSPKSEAGLSSDKIVHCIELLVKLENDALRLLDETLCDNNLLTAENEEFKLPNRNQAYNPVTSLEHENLTQTSHCNVFLLTPQNNDFRSLYHDKILRDDQLLEPPEPEKWSLPEQIPHHEKLVQPMMNSKLQHENLLASMPQRERVHLREKMLQFDNLKATPAINRLTLSKNTVFVATHTAHPTSTAQTSRSMVRSVTSSHKPQRESLHLRQKMLQFDNLKATPGINRFTLSKNNVFVATHRAHPISTAQPSRSMVGSVTPSYISQSVHERVGSNLIAPNATNGIFSTVTQPSGSQTGMLLQDNERMLLKGV